MSARTPRFLGFEADWRDEVFEFEVRFAAAPDREALRWLGERWHRWSVPADKGAWLFSGPFATWSFSPRQGQERDALSEARILMIELASRAPLIEAIFLGAEEDFPPLAPGPRYPGSPRPPDPGLPEPTSHPAFDAAFDAARGAALDAKVAAILEDADDQPIKLAPCAAPPPPPPQESYSDAARAWLPSCVGAMLRGPLEAPRVLLSACQSRDRLPAPLDKLPLPEGLAYAGAPFALGPEDRALVGLIDTRAPIGGEGRDRPRVLCLVTRAAITPLWRASDHDLGICGCAWLDAGHVAIGTGKRTVVVSLSGGAPLAELPGGGSVEATAEGRLLVVCGHRLGAWIDGRLSRVARYHPDLELAAVEPGGAVLHLIAPGMPDRYFALEGVEEALAGLSAKKSSRRKPSPRFRLEPIPFAELAPEETEPQMSDAHRAVIARAGHAIGFVRPYTGRVEWTSHRADRAAAVTASGIVFLDLHSHDVTSSEWPDRHPFALGRLQLSPDGTRAFATDCNDIIEAAPGKPRAVLAFGTGALKLLHILDFRVSTADELVILMAQGVARVTRTASGTLAPAAAAKVVKPTSFLVDLARRQVLVAAQGKSRLLLFALDTMRKLAAFTEDIDTIRLGPAGWQAADTRCMVAWRIVG